MRRGFPTPFRADPSKRMHRLESMAALAARRLLGVLP
jgi:hypothetical protein